MRHSVLLFFICITIRNFSQDTIYYSSLSKPQYETWKQIEERWIKEKYYPFLKREKIKLTCSGCESAYVWLAFKKDSLTTNYTILKAKKCGEELNEKTLNNLKKILNQITLPKEFNHTIFKTRLGVALKC
jgi:hypothetical protein